MRSVCPNKLTMMAMRAHHFEAQPMQKASHTIIENSLVCRYQTVSLPVIAKVPRIDSVNLEGGIKEYDLTNRFAPPSPWPPIISLIASSQVLSGSALTMECVK